MEKNRFYDNFGKVWSASGGVGFFGKKHSYPFHNILRALGVRLDAITDVMKTTTLEPRPSLEMVMRCKYDLEYRKKFDELMGGTDSWRKFAPKDCGNMPFSLKPPFNPTELFPKCIWLGSGTEFIGNSVGLSGPGLVNLMKTKLWQKNEDNFMLSVMSVKTDDEEAMDQYRQIADLLGRLFAIGLKTKFVGIQDNSSSPNAGMTLSEYLRQVGRKLDILFPRPRIVKLNIFTPVEFAREICKHPQCGGLCLTNTFSIEQLKQFPDLYEKFRKATGKKNPLGCFPSSGYSGAAIFPPAFVWLRKFREDGNSHYVNFGGGLNSAGRVKEVLPYADSVMIGGAYTKAPFKINEMIDAANS